MRSVSEQRLYVTREIAMLTQAGRDDLIASHNVTTIEEVIERFVTAHINRAQQLRAEHDVIRDGLDELAIKCPVPLTEEQMTHFDGACVMIALKYDISPKDVQRCAFVKLRSTRAITNTVPNNTFNFFDRIGLDADVRADLYGILYEHKLWYVVHNEGVYHSDHYYQT